MIIFHKCNNTSIDNNLFELSSFQIKLGHLKCQIIFGICQFDFLWSHNFDHPLVHIEGSHPFAQALTGF